MTQSLVGRVAVVTGSAQGIGAQTVLTLDGEGAQVVLNHRSASTANRARHVVARLTERGGFAVCAYITQLTEIRSLTSQTLERFGGIDIVGSNAGRDVRFKPIADVSEEEYDRAINRKAKANFFVLQEAAKVMLANARIVVIASTTTTLAPAGTPLYGGAKASVKSYARGTANELGPRGITVNGVSPGLIGTDAMRAAVRDEARIEAVARTIVEGSGARTISQTSLRLSSVIRLGGLPAPEPRGPRAESPGYATRYTPIALRDRALRYGRARTGADVVPIPDAGLSTHGQEVRTSEDASPSQRGQS